MNEKVGDLKAAEYNPRTISERQLAMLGKAMKEYGDLSGIVVNLTTGRVVGGHQRLKHLDKSWPIVKAPATDATGTVALGHIDTPNGRWQYREVEWDEKKEMAANIAANRHGGEFDMPMLKDMVVHLDDGLLDMDLLGFTPDALDEMFGSGSAVPIGAPDLKAGDRDHFQQVTFILHDTQKLVLDQALEAARAKGLDESVNKNGNGNALFAIAEAYLADIGEGDSG